jgi:general transcription factor 3C polypeptide 3 (transcription factor C subunit 4)
LAGQATDASGTFAVGSAAATSLFEESKSHAASKTKSSSARSAGRLTHAQLRELEAKKEKEVVRGWRALKDLWPKIHHQDQEGIEALRLWMIEAEKLVETFRETRNLFMTTRVSSCCQIYENAGN